MGLDLTLCPDKSPSLMWFLAYDRIGLDRDYLLFDMVKALVPRPFAGEQSFRWYADDGLDERMTDPYGSPLTFLTAGELAGVTLPADVTAWNRAAWAFLRELQPETNVVLWWH